MERCPKCGYKDDPVLSEKFARVSLRELTSGDKLADAINFAGWRGQELVPMLDSGGSTWRLQRFKDCDNDDVIAVHNGNEWVGAYWNSPYEYIGFYDVTEHSLQSSAGEYLKQFEPTE